jgi:hypothetical protein
MIIGSSVENVEFFTRNLAPIFQKNQPERLFLAKHRQTALITTHFHHQEIASRREVLSIKLLKYLLDLL